METVDIAVKPDELEHIGIGAVAQREDPSRAVVGIRKLTGIEIKSDDIDPVRVRQIRGSSGEARNVASKVRWIDQYQYAVAGAARTIVKCDRDTRGGIELDGAASDHGAAAGHRVLYMQRAAITRLEHAEIDDGVTCIERKDAASNIGIDRSGRIIDQRQVTIARADLAGAGNGVVKVRQDRIRARPDDRHCPPRE